MAANPQVVDTNVPGEPRMPDTETTPVIEPMIQVEVQDRLLRELKRRLFPSDVEGILYSAIVGDIYWQDQLWSLMVDTWPRLATNLGKLRQAVSSMEYAVTPYSEADNEPSDSAMEKADFVKTALFGMRSDVARQEHDFKESLEDIVDSIIAGFTVMEVYWESRQGLGIVPQCTRWLPARYYRYPYVLDDNDRLMLNPSGNLGGTQLVDFPAYKFLVCIKQSHANHPVFTSPMRCLTAWWISSRFGLEWFQTFAQLFGVPHRMAYYTPGDDVVYNQLVAMMRQSASATWGVYPKGTDVQIHANQGTSGAMPQERLIEQADKVCDIMLLGQTLTTEVRESGGNRALGTVHRKVMDEVMEAAAKYCAKLITAQIIPGIVQYNWGNTDELPVLEPVINTPIDLFNLAQSYNILFNQMKIPVLNKELYARIEFTPPEDDDDVYQPPTTPAPVPFGAPRSSPEGTKPEPAGSPNGNGLTPKPEPKPNIVQRVGAVFDPDEPRDEEGRWTEGGGMLEGAKASKIRDGRVLWHGTNEKSSSFSASEVYLTDQHDQAIAYARGAHHIESRVSEPVVYKTKVKGGKSLNINGSLEKAMGEGDDFGDVLDNATKFGRENGYRYLEYDHPSVGKDEYHHVVVSLYPNEDVKKVGWHNVKASLGGSDDDIDLHDVDELVTTASVAASRKVSFALDYGEEPEPGEVLRFIEGANPHRHPKTGRFIKAPSTAPKRKVGVKQPVEVGLMCKENVDAGDDRVCQACKDISAEGWIPVDEEFLGYSMNPPHHPNCRCSLDYKTRYKGVDVYHQAKRNPYRHPKTGRFVSKKG